MAELEAQIDALWDHRDDMTAVMSETEAAVCVRAAIDLLDCGEARVAERIGDDVVVHQWLKRAILLLFRLTHMETMELGPFEYRDKIPLKRDYEAAGVRVVPGASARWGAYLAPGRDHDAELREHRRARRRGFDGRHVGDGRLVRADRRAGASRRRRRHRWRARAAGRGADHGR